MLLRKLFFRLVIERGPAGIKMYTRHREPSIHPVPDVARLLAGCAAMATVMVAVIITAVAPSAKVAVAAVGVNDRREVRISAPLFATEWAGTRAVGMHRMMT